jgi:hypothetical protein
LDFPVKGGHGGKGRKKEVKMAFRRGRGGTNPSLASFFLQARKKLALKTVLRRRRPKSSAAAFNGFRLTNGAADAMMHFFKEE